MPDISGLLQDVAEFRRGFSSVMMATVGASGAPTASYAPYVTDETGDGFVLLSGLARHTRDLLETGEASLLFVENEAAAQNIFGRRRLTCACTATEVSRDDPEWAAKLDRLRARQGKMVEMLRQLPDFRLFRLSPRGGSWVGGFAQAQPLADDDVRAILRSEARS